MKDKKIKVTKDQFQRYQQVQESGRFNMLDPNARIACGLSNDVYLAILDAYGDLKAEYGSREVS